MKWNEKSWKYILNIISIIYIISCFTFFIIGVLDSINSIDTAKDVYNNIDIFVELTNCIKLICSSFLKFLILLGGGIFFWALFDWLIYKTNL